MLALLLSDPVSLVAACSAMLVALVVVGRRALSARAARDGEDL